MSEISIRRRHGKTFADARRSAEHMAQELRAEFDLHYEWAGNVLHFKRPGVSGELILDDQEVAVRIRLGLLLFAVKGSIEREVHRYFDENFPA